MFGRGRTKGVKRMGRMPVVRSQAKLDVLRPPIYGTTIGEVSL
jgi:hypothetical protein